MIDVKTATDGQTTLRVLLAASDTRIFRLALEVLGGSYRVEHERVDSPDTMRRLLAAADWDLLLCDPMLSRCGCREIVAELQERGSDLLVVALTDDGDERLIGELLGAGVATALDRAHLGRLVPIVARRLEDVRVRRLRELQVLIRSSPDPMLIVRADGRMLHANRLVQQLLGYTEAELAGQPIELLIPEHMRASHARHRQRYATAPHARPMGTGVELAARHKNGQVIPVEISLGPVRLAGESLVCCGVRDLRERKRSERLLRAILEGVAAQVGDEFLRALVENLALALDVRCAFISEFPASGAEQARVLAFWNGQGFSEPFDYPLAGTPCASVKAASELLVREAVRARFPGDRRLESLRAESFFGLRLRDSSGRALGVLAIVDGKPLADDAIARTVMRIFAARAGAELERLREAAALAASEARFRNLTELSADWQWESDENHHTVTVGTESGDKPGVRPPGFIGKAPWEFAGTSLSEAEWAAFRARLDARETFRGFEYCRPSADGKLRWVSVSGTPMFHADGAFKGYRGVGRDITEQKISENTLREREAELRLLTDSVPAMIAYADARRRYRYANRRYRKFYAPSDAPLEGRTLEEVLGADIMRSAGPHIERAYAGESVDFQGTRRRRDGRTRILDVSLVPHRDGAGRVLGVYILAIDVTRRQRAEKILQLRNRAIESSVNSIMITEPADGEQKITYVNPAFERITGYSAAEVLGSSPRFLHGEDDSQPGLADLRAALREQREGTALLRNYRKDGSLFWNELRVAPVRDEAGRVTNFIGVGSDATERIRYQGEIERNANYDALTDLPNRNLLGDRLAQAIASAERTGSPAAVLYIDLDQFKRINDSLGHAMGDQVIASIGARLAAALRTGDTVARWGGDEFVAVLTNLNHQDDVARIVEKLRRVIAAPLRIEAHEFVLTASIGIALAPKDGSDGAMLLRNADAALYRAKEQGRDCFRFFAAEMNRHAVRYLSLEHDLRGALDAGEFWLQYQPVVQLATGEAVGVEALIRWRQPDGRVVAPAEFIPVAEESGLIVPIGRWVLETAMQQAAAWNRGRRAPLFVSVNLSARQFRDPSLLEMIRAALERARLDPSLLKLEITESTVMQNAEDAALTLHSLKDLGVLLSVDDFGTGYSSLSYLKRFPIDTLKIDRSFVRGLPADRDDLAICRAVLDMAQGLGLEVVAEGIETAEQAAILLSHGCQFAQGYLFSRPVDPAALEETIRRLSFAPR